MKKLSIIFLFAGFLLLVGCSAGEKNEASSNQETEDVSNFKNSDAYNSEQEKEGTNNEVAYKTITSEEAKELLANNEVIIIDVRKQETFSDNHIPNAQNIPLKELEAKLPELDKSVSYLVVCQTGKTSETACKLLAQNGFIQLYNLSGGMDDWTGEIVN